MTNEKEGLRKIAIRLRDKIDQFVLKRYGKSAVWYKNYDKDAIMVAFRHSEQDEITIPYDEIEILVNKEGSSRDKVEKAKEELKAELKWYKNIESKFSSNFRHIIRATQNLLNALDEQEKFCEHGFDDCEGCEFEEESVADKRNFEGFKPKRTAIEALTEKYREEFYNRWIGQPEFEDGKKQVESKKEVEKLKCLNCGKPIESGEFFIQSSNNKNHLRCISGDVTIDFKNMSLDDIDIFKKE